METKMDIDLTNIKIETYKFKGELRIDIRKWNQDKDSGEWSKTTKGINLNLEEWYIFNLNLSAINDFISKSSEFYFEKIVYGS